MGAETFKNDKRDDTHAKILKPNAGLVPDVIGVVRKRTRIELCRAWGKTRDEHCLFFFDDGAKANFISPKLTAKLGTRPERWDRSTM